MVEPNRFIDLADIDLGVEGGPTEPLIKVAELSGRSDVALVSEQVYKGRIVIVDYTPINDDATEVAAVSTQLSAVARDCNGDLVSVGRSLIVITPNGIRVDRERLRRK